MSTFAEKVRTHLAYLNIKGKEIANAVGKSQQQFSAYISTENPVIPPVEVAKKVAKFLNLPIGYLLDDKLQVDLSLHANAEKFTINEPPAAPYTFRKDIQKLIDEIHTLPEEEQELVWQMIDNTLKLRKGNKR